MDFVVSYWDSNAQKSCVQYLNSKFPMYCSAEVLQTCLDDALKELGLSKMIQLSMDGRHVNQLLYENIDLSRKERNLPSLINIGSCSLHIFHGAFQYGCLESKWSVNQLLKNLYALFHEAPSVEVTNISVTKSTQFPLKFCSHRWIESQPVADRAIAIWPHVVNMTKFWKRRMPSKQLQSNNFKIVSSAVNDPLTTVKLKFFSYVASVLRPYLEKYQNNDPLVPMMACHALQLAKKIDGHCL